MTPSCGDRITVSIFMDSMLDLMLEAIQSASKAKIQGYLHDKGSPLSHTVALLDFDLEHLTRHWSCN